ncbi:MAG: TonB-dependent receptor [Desulfobacterales bacterium]|nr:TonB-dependent receptor [Desulfobacterales bacterium]
MERRSLKTPVRWLLVCCCLLLTSAWAAAAEKEEKKPVDIGEITVMAPQPGVEITTEKTIIRVDEFKKPGQVRSLTDILNEIGGIDVQRINPLMASPGDEVSIRGLNEGRMVIEIDGRRINHSGHFGRYIVDWSTLNMDDIERIEIIRGGHSVLHPFAIGGVINMITKKGKKTADPTPDLNVKAGYGKFDTYSVSGGVLGGFKEAVGYNFTASKQETDGYLRNNFQENTSLNGRLSFYLPGDATLDLGTKFSAVDYGYPVVNDPARSDYDPSYPDFLPTADQLRHVPPTAQFAGDQTPKWYRKTNYFDAILQVPAGSGTMKLHGFMTLGRRWNYYYRGAAFISDKSDDKTQGVIAEYRDLELFDDHRFTFGAEYQTLGTFDDNYYEVSSAYVQDVYRLSDRWTLTPGARYYHVGMNTYYSQFGTGWPIEGKEQTDDGFYPSLKADFLYSPQTALYAAVSRSYRLPCP